MNVLRRRKQEQATMVEPFNVNSIEDDIRDVLQPPSFLHRAPEPAPPALEPPPITAEDIGKITAEAVATDHEAIAQAIATLGTELASEMAAIDKLKLDVDVTLKDIMALTEHCREMGKVRAEKIASAAKHNAEVRDLVEAMRKKISDA